MKIVSGSSQGNPSFSETPVPEPQIIRDALIALLAIGIIVGTIVAFAPTQTNIDRSKAEAARGSR